MQVGSGVCDVQRQTSRAKGPLLIESAVADAEVDRTGAQKLIRWSGSDDFGRGFPSFPFRFLFCALRLAWEGEGSAAGIH